MAKVPFEISEANPIISFVVNEAKPVAKLPPVVLPVPEAPLIAPFC